jgi:hypothetical protein
VLEPIEVTPSTKEPQWGIPRAGPDDSQTATRGKTCGMGERTRAAVAGAGAAIVWGLQEPLDRRLFGYDYSDVAMYLGPSRSADLLEVVTIVRDDGSELAIHAMSMRAKYQRLLPGE